jgi:hypothetical protein
VIEIESYLKERDAVDWRQGVSPLLYEAGLRNEPGGRISLHKLRTAITTMPDEMRKASRQWLTERGYQPWD